MSSQPETCEKHKSREPQPGRQGRVRVTPGQRLHAMTLKVNDRKPNGKSTDQGPPEIFLPGENEAWLQKGGNPGKQSESMGTAIRKRRRSPPTR